MKSHIIKREVFYTSELLKKLGFDPNKTGLAVTDEFSDKKVRPELFIIETVLDTSEKRD